MKKEIRKMAGDIIQITTIDERWYSKVNKNKELIYLPSVTWICEHYPKGVHFYKWLAQKGWDEAEAIKSAAGDKGSRVHYAINDLLDGKTIAINSTITNADGEEEELSLEEYQCVMSFVSWWKEVKPIAIGKDITVWNEEHGYAGTIDLICIIDGKIWIIDFKTSQHIWASHELQVSAYKHGYQGIVEIISRYKLDDKEVYLAILQLGYKMNKKKYKFTEIKDKFNLFLSAKEIWANETDGQEPLQRDYPMELKIEFNEAARLALKTEDQQRLEKESNT